jgi:SPP1 family predicted phage head-tail adaptor
MPFDIGKARHRLALQAVSTVADALGGQSEMWATEATIWARVEPLSGRELVQAQQVASEATHRVTIRYRTGVTTAKRFKLGTRTLNITSVINPGELGETLVLLCTESTPAEDPT